MSDDITGKVKALLDDPDAVAKIAAIAGGLGLGSKSPQPESAPVSAPQERAGTPAQPVSAPASKPPAPGDPRLSLLNSLKPFLRPERRDKVENLTKALSMATLFGALGKKEDK